MTPSLMPVSSATANMSSQSLQIGGHGLFQQHVRPASAAWTAALGVKGMGGADDHGLDAGLDHHLCTSV